MKNLFIILLVLCTFSGFSQRKFIHGAVKDSTTNEELMGVHVRNLTSKNLTTTNEFGGFRIPVAIGDTLMLSHIGYEVFGWVVEESWFSQNQVQFRLQVDTVYLEEVVIGQFPEYRRFKQLIVDTQPEDTSFWYYGVPLPVVKNNDVPTKKELMNPLSLISHPITYWHRVFSKEEKEKRKIQEVRRRQPVVTKARQKFTREWVGEMTMLKGDQLTDFIAYCKFTPEYLAKTELYFIHENMMAKLNDFLSEHADG